MRFGRRSALLAGSLLAALAAAGLALSAAFASPDGLTPAERAALRIVSVKAFGAEGAGIFVRVTFAGNLEKAIGRGHLKNAVVAMILRPKDAGFATADLATEGPGAIGLTSKKTRSNSVGVVRNGKVFTFFIAGPGSSNVATAVAKTFASLPGRKPARTTAGKAVSPGEWERIERDIATSEALAGIEELTVDNLELSCANLRYWYSQVLDDLARARLRKADLQALGRRIDAEIADAKTKITKHSKLTTTLLKPANAALDLALTLLGGAPRDRMYTWKDVVRNLELDRRLVDAYSDRNDKVIQRLAELKGRIEGLHKAKCNPSGTAPPPAPTTTFRASLRTSYTHPGGNTSTLCVRVTTSPAKPGSGVNVTVTGPGVVGPAKQTLTLDGSGQIVANVSISAYGTYSVTATVSAGDETETAAATQEVKSTQATCPPP